MVSKRSTRGFKGKTSPSQSEGDDSVSASDSSAFERLLHEAARVYPSGGMLARGMRLCAGRFEIVRRIGEGGMGVVYEALDSARDEKVALKTLQRIEAGDIYRLKNEFRALADVSHPNLVGLHELFADAGLWFFSMDLIHGERFDQWVRPDGVRSEARLRAALPQLLRAANAIHCAGKLHRDLKPSNVLITPAGRVVVLDFGLAVDSELGGVGQTVADKKVNGTPEYMAPEQAAGQAATAASDVYAIGAMVFEALSGKLPFEGHTMLILQQKQTAEAPSLIECCPDTAPDLVALCESMLRLSPIERASAVTLLERTALLGDPISAAPSAPDLPQEEARELVGREAELAALHAAHGSACDGDRPVVVLMSGQSGIGKSALLETFLAGLRREGRAVLFSGRCYERESVPFKGFDALVDGLSRYLRRQTSVEAAGLVPREAYALRRLFPVLGRIEAIASAPERDIRDAFELRRRGFLALGELLGRIRDRRPLVLAIDDWQWSDGDSTALLLQLARQADSPKVLLIVSHRSEGMADSPVLAPLYETLLVDSRLDARTLTVEPLSRVAAACLVSTQRSDRDAVLQEAGGNPFLLRELSRACDGANKRSLAEVLQARVASLPPTQRALLEVLAVAARPLRLQLAADAAGSPTSGHASFEALRAAQLARSAVQRGSLECYHDKVRESVAVGLPEVRTRAIHAAIAAALQKTSDPDPEHLALHLEHAGERRLAAAYAVSAARRAAAANAFEQAARLYEKALALGSVEGETKRGLLVAFGDALACGGQDLRAAEVYLRARIGAPKHEAQSLTRAAAQAFLHGGRLGRGRELFAEVLQPLSIHLPRSPTRALSSLAYERCRLWLRGLDFSEREPDPALASERGVIDSAILGLTGSDPLSCAALNARALRRALDAGDKRGIASGLLMDMYCRSLGVGRARAVPELGRRVRQLLDEAHWGDGNSILLLVLALYDTHGTQNGDLAAALERFDQVLAHDRAEPTLFSTYRRTSVGYHRTVALLQLGRVGELAVTLPALVDEAWQQSNMLFLPLQAYTLAAALPALGMVLEADREVSRIAKAWSALDNPYAVQDHFLARSKVTLAWHRRDARTAWALCAANDTRFSASLLSRWSHAAVGWQCLRGMVAAQLASETSDASERRMLIAEAQRAPHVGGASPRAGTLLLSRAAGACARRDHERAVRLLREFDARPRPPGVGPWTVRAAQRRLGVLLGGDEGRALVRDADDFFRCCGASDPEHFVATSLPGLQIA